MLMQWMISEKILNDWITQACMLVKSTEEISLSNICPLFENIKLMLVFRKCKDFYCFSMFGIWNTILVAAELLFSMAISSEKHKCEFSTTKFVVFASSDFMKVRYVMYLLCSYFAVNV